MSNVSVEKLKLDVLATAISNKSGVPVTMTLAEMVDAVDNIQIGGDQHGTIWQDNQGNVHLDDESGIDLQSKTATPTESQQVIEADEGYYALDTVTVGAISSSYVGSGITRRSSSDLTASGATVTAPAGYYSAQASKSVATGTAGTPTATKSEVFSNRIFVTPSVTNTTGYITGGTETGNPVVVSASELVSGTFNVSSSGVYNVTDYASINVQAGTEGTPIATKSSVYNHAISVTPQVTNSEGCITGGTKTGTAVTVSASELVSGTKSITENGTGIDVTNYASVNVQISKTYTATITSAGSSSSVYITYKNVKYYTVGTFTFTAEDDFSVVATGNVGGQITYNDDVYNVTSKSFTFPNSDITISMSTGSTGRVNIQTSMLPITTNGIQTVNGYDRVNVLVTPTLSTKNITANGTYNASSDSADGYSYVTVNVTSVPSVVTGTFTTNSANAGTAVDISIPYTGNGYPIDLMIDVDGGIDGNTTYASLIDKYSIARASFSKEYYSQTPTYASSGTENLFRHQYLYKSSDSSATSYSGSNSTSFLTSSSNPTASASNFMRMKSATTLSVFVKASSYGFSPGIAYRYLILYSS